MTESRSAVCDFANGFTRLISPRPFQGTETGLKTVSISDIGLAMNGVLTKG